jgi:cation diffusion facilitator family transporter
MPSEEEKTVYAALGANVTLFVLKLGGGLYTGSVALLAEAAHSLAVTGNQGNLLISLKLGGRPPDEQHPFGYGKERYFWAFLTAMVIFVVGAGFSVALAAYELFLRGHVSEHARWVPYVILGLALVFEGASLARAVRETREEARRRGRGFLEHIRVSKDPTTKTVVLEDSAAVLGALAALAGVALAQVTGHGWWEAVSALVIAGLLATGAVLLVLDNRGMIIGEAAPPDERRRLRDTILRHDGVEDVVELLTMYQGPGSLLVAARLDLAPDLNGDEAEELATRIERALRDEVPDVYQVFLDPTSRLSSRPAGRG